MTARALRRTVAALVLGAFLSLPAPGWASDELPSALLAQLVHKVITFDKNAAERGKTRPRLVIVQRAEDDRSVRAAAVLASKLGRPESGNRAPVEVLSYTSASDLRSSVRERGISVVVLVNGLEDAMPAIAAAVDGLDVLTVGTTGALVERGAAVGFEVREGKPKLVVNRARARAQNVAFQAELLNLARLL